jgi:predicted RNase H-like nuclease (RuvC/YqgF family)
MTSDNVSDLTVRILREIRDGVRETNGQLDQTNKRLSALTVELRSGFDRLDQRVDNVLLGQHGREHTELRERIARLEQQLGL